MIYSVHQPHYLPYPGYLAKVDGSDIFVFLDEVQFVKREFQNRNKVKGPEGSQWLTVPVKGEYKAEICEMLPDKAAGWETKHIETLKRFYSKTEHFNLLALFQEILDKEHDTLADLCINSTKFFLDVFDIRTDIHRQSEISDLPETPNERIIQIGKRLGADTYLAGAGGRNYMEIGDFADAGIKVIFQEYSAREYPQVHGDFIPHLGAIDLLLNCGTRGF